MTTILTADNLDTIRAALALFTKLDLAAGDEADFVQEGAPRQGVAWLEAVNPHATLMSPVSVGLGAMVGVMTVLENIFALALAEKERAERVPAVLAVGTGIGSDAAWMAEVDRVAAEDAATKDFWKLMIGVKPAPDSDVPV